jgi:hypothetical protein
LDTGALLALERRHRQTALDLLRADVAGLKVLIPAGCLAQAWRDGARQVPLVQLLDDPGTEVEALDGSAARRIGELLRRTRTSDVVDAHVAHIAMRDRRTIITSDPDDLRVLAPGARIEAV